MYRVPPSPSLHRVNQHRRPVPLKQFVVVMETRRFSRRVVTVGDYLYDLDPLST
jgi:hypothetical protein